jgi:mono/diheme cytochrome c family protein
VRALVVCLTIAAAGAGGTVVARALPSASPIPARQVTLAPVGRFDQPVLATAPTGDPRRLFVVEKGGTIGVLLDGRRLAAHFLDISTEVATGNEPGLLSMAFSPDYTASGLFYVYLTGRDRRTHLLEYRRSASDPNRADATTRRQVLSFAHPSGEHFGGLLLVGPDSNLYLSTGDGGLTEWQDKMRAQRATDVNGKILRVDPRTGTVHVVSRGLRNPWRYTFDERTGDLYVGDAGEFVRESIDYAPAARVQGANFGWPCFEGGLANPKYPASLCPGARKPLFEYAREGGNCSVIGGVVSHDARLRYLDGWYLYADFCLGEIIALRARGGKLWRRRSLRVYSPGVTSFGKDATGRAYVTTLGGAVYRLDPRAPADASTAPAPESGRELFLAAGCGTCHTLAAAGTVGTYGPDLDRARPSRDVVVERVTFGIGLMPAFGGRLDDRQIDAIADFVAGGR